MSEDTVRIPRQERSIAKKEQIKETVLLLFSEKGYHNVSTNEIAKVAGISIGTLYSYYPNKDLIYEELVGDLYEDVLEKLEPASPLEIKNPRDLIKSYIEYIFKCHSYMTGFQKEISSLSLQDEKYRKLEEPYRIFAVNKILSLLEDYKSQLKITDYSTAAIIIQTTIEATVHELSFFPNESDSEREINELSDMIYRYLFG